MTDWLTCGVLPFITVDQPMAFGMVEIWPSTPANWLARYGHDHTDFMAMYRDRKGAPRGEAASVVTGTGAAPRLAPELERTIEQHVVALSTLDWLSHPASRCSEPWILDISHLPKKQTALGKYQRMGKFTSTITSSAYDLIYPGPLTMSRRFRPVAGEVHDGLQEVAENPGENGSLIQALRCFRDARYEMVFYSAPGDDHERLWAGFERLYDIPRRPTVIQNPQWVAWMPGFARRRLGDFFAREVRAKREEVLISRVDAHLRGNGAGGHPFLDDLAKWIRFFYGLRSAHTHGGEIDVGDLYDSRRRIRGVQLGVRVAESLLRLRLIETAELRRKEVTHIEALFAWRDPVDELLRMLGNSSASDWYPTPSRGADDLERLHDLVKLLDRYRGAAFGRVEQNRVRRASKKLALVLSKWAQALIASPPRGADVTPLAELGTVIGDAVADARKKGLDNPKTDIAVDAAAVGHLFYTQAFRAESYGIKGVATVPASLLLGGRIPIWEWVAAYIDLCDLDGGPAMPR